jgi:uncharacterized membrane protein YqgA involved in biofilm formation
MNRFSQNDNMQFLGSLLTWMGILLAISVAISFILPFSWSLAVVVGIFLLLDFYLIRKASRKMRNGYSENSVFDSLSSLFNSGGGMANNGSLKYYCISWGVQHKQVSCPKCGSKIERVGS